MRVLVTGTDGYIGAVLASDLSGRGYDVVGVDTGYYRDGCLYGTGDSATTIRKDIRLLTAEDVSGVDAVVHLAELSNDPVGQLRPEITDEINHHGSVRLARLARSAGVERFVYTSSCSVYGIATSGTVDEESPLNPQTPYAHAKVLVERDVSSLTADDFSPVFLRNATAYGASPRMRFDIVLNNLAGHAWTIREIRMDSDGTPWRPFVHVLDISRAVACVLEAPRAAVHNQLFNVGDSGANYRVREVADIVGSTFPGCNVTLGELGADNRSYRVSFAKIADALPDFRCEWTLEDGARELRDLFEKIDLSRETFEFRGFTRLKQLQYLLETRQLDDRFFWRNGAVH